MITGQTSRSASHTNGVVRPDIDRTAARYFVYTLRDGGGAPVYIGRSCNVAQRIKAHHATGAGWVHRVRSVTMTGPYTWDEAVTCERDEIELWQQPANISMTARDHRASVAARSAARGRR